MKLTTRRLISLVALTLPAFTPSLLGQTTPTVTTIYSFTGGPADESALIQGSDGNFYGTTFFGGSHQSGTVFKITPAGTLTTLHSFSAVDSNNENADGYGPSTLLQADDGNFYGTNQYGGSHGSGTLFKITPAGTLTTLHIFSARDSNDENADGVRPCAALIQGSDGNLYGTTGFGGGDARGTVFKITPAGTLTTLHSFTGHPSDGANPSAGLTLGKDGNFYGTTAFGGSYGEGTVFKITPAGVLTTQHSCEDTEADAASPADLVQGSDGNFYGTTAGDDTHGTVFKITSAGVFTTLHYFIGGTDGNGASALVQRSDGNFYGVTGDGGSSDDGTVFKITPAGVLTTVHSFSAVDDNGVNTDGASPSGALVQGSDGNFYGTTNSGGSNGDGTVFRMNVVPAITSAASATAYVGKAFTYQIKATNNPASYGVGGLFAGVKVDQQTGLISGTPTEAGTHTLTLRATNSLGTGSQTLTLTVLGPPVITSGDTATAQVGEAFSYQIKASNSPTSYGVGGLRPGLSVDAKTGKITGTPTGAGTFTLTLKAASAAGSDTQSLTLTINPSTPVVTSPDTATATVGKSFTYQIKATSNPTSFGVGGLFKGLTVDQKTGLISGTPTSAGTHSLDLRATNAGGTGHETLTLTVAAK